MKTTVLILVKILVLMNGKPVVAQIVENVVQSIFPSIDSIIKDGDEFDYIVVGAGAAGAAAASRLALAGADVLLVEAGGDQNSLSKVPGAAFILQGSEIDWQYKTIPNNISCLSSRERQCRFSRGKCLGGSTSINYMLYVRGNRQDYDDLNITNWSWKDIEPYFLRYEGFQSLDRVSESSIPYHNTSGIMKMELFSESGNSWHSRIISGFESLNFPYNPDINAYSQIGVSQLTGYVYKNERMSTARGYLNNAEIKSRLKVAIHTRCTRVIIDENNTARGIFVVNGPLNKKMKLYAKREVILSAGAIETPKILMLSGIGPGNHLKQLGIPLRSDLPVGQDMSDHVLPIMVVLVDHGFGVNIPNLGVFAMKGIEAIEWLKKKTGPLASNGLTDVAIFANTNCYDFENRKLLKQGADCELPTLEVIHAYIDRNIIQGNEPVFQHVIGFNDEIVKQLSEANINNAFIVVSPVVLQPFSKGYVRLASTDPLQDPDIFPNYLSDNRDTDEMLRSIRIVEDLIETEVFKRYNASILHLRLDGCPEYEKDRLGYWRCYCRHMTYSVYHAVGTAALKKVVDVKLRVQGIKRLRVADLSILPQIPRGNTASVAIAIGERVADFIQADSSSNNGS